MESFSSWIGLFIVPTEAISLNPQKLYASNIWDCSKGVKGDNPDKTALQGQETWSTSWIGLFVVPGKA